MRYIHLESLNRMCMIFTNQDKAFCCWVRQFFTNTILIIQQWNSAIAQPLVKKTMKQKVFGPMAHWNRYLYAALLMGFPVHCAVHLEN